MLRTLVVLTAMVSAPAAFGGDWIWTGEAPANPKNRFTYFRKVVELKALPEDASLRVAADSNARVWINGQVVRRKVTRYHEERITAEVVNAGPYLKAGRNVIVVLHHNWGPIITFQRSANKHAGLYVDGAWAKSDSSWRWITAPEFLAHERQIVGVNTHARIRYPVVMDGRRVAIGDVHDAGFDDRGWKAAAAVKDGPWPAVPAEVETEAQREYPVRPEAVVAAGTVERPKPDLGDPFSMAAGIRTGRYRPSAGPETGASRPVVLEGQAGEWRYITYDFHRPVHGYPLLEVESSVAGAVIDLGYTEIAVSLYSGAKHVDTDGWMNPEGVVGAGYADRYVAQEGRQRVEMPDERTARWLGVQVYFPAAGRVVLREAGLVKSQYPVRQAGGFECGDERVGQIVKLALMHAEVTMNDVYVDTPGREDGQWIEDSRVRALIADRWFGEWKLRRILLRHSAESQGKDGGFHAFPPANFPAYPVNYDWSVQWAAMLYDDWQWTGSTELIRRYWGTLERYWDNALARVGEDGIFRTNRVFADIRVGVRLKDAGQSSGIVTPFLIDRLRWSAEMARAVGRSEHGARWADTADRMAAAFRKHHLVRAGGTGPLAAGDRFDPRDPALERGISQAGQAMTILAGLMSREESRAALDYTFPDPEGTPPAGVTRWNNPTFAYRALRSLSDNGHARRAVAHLLERYGPYLPGHPRNKTAAALQGPHGGPLPEYWISREDLGLKDGEPNQAQPVDDTGSHGWGAVPLLWLHDSLLGVRIAEPGGGKLRIAPEDGGLPFVSGWTVTPKGPVWVNWEAAHWRLEVRIPRGVAAELRLPEPFAGKRTACAHEGAAPGRAGEREYRLAEEGAYVFTAR